MATEVTLTPDLSTMTQALPLLSQTDLQTIKTNIQALLETPDDAKNSKMPSLAVLSEADVPDNFSLGSLDNTNLTTTKLKVIYHLHLFFNFFC